MRHDENEYPQKVRLYQIERKDDEYPEGKFIVRNSNRGGVMYVREDITAELRKQVAYLHKQLDKMTHFVRG